MIYRCTKHGVTLELGQGRRTVTVPPLGPDSSGTPRCALLTARNPRAGRLPVRDAMGFNTGEFCEIEEAGG